jgi:uncharacterized protein (TIGR03435 family)
MRQLLGGNSGFGTKALLAFIGISIVVVLPIFGVVNAPLLRAQSSQTEQTTNASLPVFEAASIKPNNSASLSMSGSVGDNLFRMSNATPIYLIKYAFNMQDDQIAGAPNWVDAKRYDIDAKVGDDEYAKWLTIPYEQRRNLMRQAMQSLLTDRFKLKVTHETKQLPVYALVLAKGGPKMTESTDPPNPIPDCPRPCLSSNNSTMDGLAGSLGQILRDRVVLNETGLTGHYVLALHWVPQSQSPSDQPDDSGPSIFTALEEQLGLRIESTTGPVDTIVIDHIEEPSSN